MVSNFWKIFVAIIITLLFVASTTWYFLDYINNQEITAKDNQIFSLQMALNTANQKLAASETVNWKTYINPIENYSVKYPADWFSEYSIGRNYPDAQVSDTSNLYISAKKIVPCTDACAAGPYDSVFKITVTNENRTLDRVFDESFAGRTGVERTPVTIDDQIGIKVNIDCAKNESLGCGQPTWLTIYKNKLYTFSSGLSYQMTYDTIVSTFNFTN